VAKLVFRESVCSHVARILREKREQQKISMTRLAEMSGLSQGMISLVEHEQRNPTLETLLRITTALGIELSRVIAEAETAAKRKK
jgi:transcriptional regulator with XRE-family HTH domain